MYPYYIDSYYLILVLPAIILSLYAQMRVKSTFSKYSLVMSKNALSGHDAAMRILRSNALTSVNVAPINGELTDNYNPKTDVISLSAPVYSSTSIAAIGVAAHESGHALQHHFGYFPIKVRNALIPAVNFGNMTAVPLAVIGLALGLPFLVNFGIILYSAVVLFQVVTLPVEFNASRRALNILKSDGMLSNEELRGAKSVLTAAALTYVAATLTSLMSLLRLILISRNNRNRR